ncbi:MAG: stage III sporulation protein AA [Clostridia bacterium]|nr:stage III sporulation protein AA [Clostridia bacterium]
MYVSNCVKKIATNKILDYIPDNIRRYMYSINMDNVYQIHLSYDKPVYINSGAGTFFISRHGVLTDNVSESVFVTKKDMETAIELISEASMYAVKNELVQGFITVNGGNRIGICGTGVIKRGEVSYIKDISSLNYRLANEVVGVSDKVLNFITDGIEIKNTLIISPPGAGKTTMLRDIARNLSELGFSVCVVDERFELASMHEGKSAFDLGVSTDVISGIPKHMAMSMVLRSMSPQVIITDELGTEQDTEAVLKMQRCGVAVIASMHGSESLENDTRKILGCFDVIINMSKKNGVGTVEEVTII